MKNLFYLLTFYSSIIFSQTAKDFLINDNEKLFKSSITNIIAESKNYGYNLKRNNKGDYIFRDEMSNYIILEKKIGSPYEEGFPSYSSGYIYKKYLFSGNLGEDVVWKIETELFLSQYSLVSTSQIKNCFKKIKNDIVKNYTKNNYTTSQTYNELNYRGGSGKYYDLIEVNCIKKPLENKDSNEVYYSENIFSNGEYFESLNGEGYYFLIFSFKDKGISNLIEKTNIIATNTKNSFDNIRFTIGNQDMRKINQYDLEAMVKFFIEDCNKLNKKVPEINTLNATFEPLEGNLIALSYALGDDTSIIIKVDPEKWAKASIEKRWYVLYHELGHDVLNLEHGQGGKMMFNFADKEYTWDDFFKDKEYMINYIKN